MRVKNSEAIRIVNKFNIEIFENLSDDLTGVLSAFEFSFHTDGHAQAIRVLDFVLWCSVDDERNYDSKTEYYEDLEVFLRREFNALIKKVGTFRLKDGGE